MNSPIRLLLADDQILFREGLKTLLELSEGLKVVGEASDGEEAIQQVERLSPDVTLMDLNMPNLDGVAATQAIKEKHPAIKILVLTTFDDDDRVFDALKAGASGYLLKDTPSAELVNAIKTVNRGESFLQPSIASKVVAEFNRMATRSQPKRSLLPEPLSHREEEVLIWLAEGFSNKEIAVKLDLAEGTVKNHVSNILGKMSVQDRTQAALMARDLGLA